jgi:hypothetical protein
MLKALDLRPLAPGPHSGVMTLLLPLALLAVIVLAPLYGVDSRLDERQRQRRWIR